MDYKHSIKPADPAVLAPDFLDIYTYWNDLRGDRLAPAWGEFKLQDLDLASIPWSVVIDVSYDSFDLVYRFWGTERARLQGHDYTGKSVSVSNHKDMLEKITRECEAVIEQRIAIYSIFDITENKGGAHIKYSFMRLPLSSDGKTVDKIYGYSRNEGARDFLHNEFGTEIPYKSKT